jgi:hypothetical protein
MEPSPAALTRLREIMVAFAAHHGDPNPTQLRMVETNSTTCDELSGHRSNQPAIPIYLVVANGNFISSGKRPLGAEAPRGTTLYMRLDRRGSDFACVGWGLGPLMPGLDRLGTFIEL